MPAWNTGRCSIGRRVLMNTSYPRVHFELQGDNGTNQTVREKQFANTEHVGICNYKCLIHSRGHIGSDRPQGARSPKLTIMDEGGGGVSTCKFDWRNSGA